MNAAQRSDLVIITLGESAASMTGEAASRAYLGLPGNQQKLLEAIVAAGKPVVLVLFTGRPLALPWAASHVSAMVEAWYPGVAGWPGSGQNAVWRRELLRKTNGLSAARGWAGAAVL